MIKSVELDGYRLLNSFKADLNQLTVVIGANATGKSTFISALQLINWSVDFPLKEAVAWSGGLSSVLSAFEGIETLRWRLTFCKPADHPFWKTVPLDDDKCYVYEVAVARDQYGEPIPVSEVLRNEKPYGGHPQPLKFLEATPKRSLVFSPKEHKLVPFDEASDKSSLPLFGPTGSASSDRGSAETFQPPQLSEQVGSLRLAQMRFINEYPIPSWTRILLSMFAFYPGFDVGRQSAIRAKPSEIRPVTILSGSGENLGTVLHEIQTRAEYRNAADEIQESLRAAYPSFDGVFAETSYELPPKVLLRIRERGMRRKLEAWELSDGMLRFLCLAAALLNPAPAAFIAVDEPEVGLHPRLLPLVADMVKTASERTQVLVTTHSPDLLNCFDIDDVAVMARDGNKIEWKRPGDRDSLRKMLSTVTSESLGSLHRSGELEAI
jgi:predicted ATPase